ncbi:MAG: alanine racemase C-terminal domain-containing protein [Bacillota bacterium]
MATLIGQNGEGIITVEEVAEQCCTITNEILSRLGSRVEKVYFK